MEYEIEAEFMHEFLRRGSRGFAYTPIIGSGFNACVLHYIENAAECKAGDVILMDVGAEYGNYASDMTRVCACFRTVHGPTARGLQCGAFSDEGRHEASCGPGVSLHDYHKQVGDLMTAQLLDLKLIDRHDVEKQNPAWPAYKKYFMHGTSHFIGLDVHDVGIGMSRLPRAMFSQWSQAFTSGRKILASDSKTTLSSPRMGSTT